MPVCRDYQHVKCEDIHANVDCCVDCWLGSPTQKLQEERPQDSLAQPHKVRTRLDLSE